MRQIVALGGGGFSMEPDNPLLDDFILGLTRKKRPRLCFVPTASGDSDSYIVRFHNSFPPARAEATHLTLFNRTVRDLRRFVLAQDVIYVGGGNTANLLAVWRLHGLDRALNAAWKAGVILCGISAGALCWFESGVTDSFGHPLDPLGNGLGLVRGSFCPHYDGEKDRRAAYHALIGAGLASGYAADDGAALHFIGRKLSAVVSSRPNARAYRVERKRVGASEVPLAARYLGRRR
ncbi:MAG: Type 1 glutamine amidotransferase-like domain-containing protein [Candidatus Binataceae bacterium]